MDPAADRQPHPAPAPESRAGRIWVRLEEGLLVLILVMLVCVGTLQVLLRYVFSRPLVWPEEFAGLLLLWLAFVGTAFASQRGSHVAVTVFLDRLPHRMQRLVRLGWEVAIAIFLVTVIWQGCLLVWLHREVENPALGYSVAFGEAALPVGALLTLVPVMANIRRLLQQRNPEILS